MNRGAVQHTHGFPLCPPKNLNTVATVDGRSSFLILPNHVTMTDPCFVYKTSRREVEKKRALQKAETRSLDGEATEDQELAQKTIDTIA